MIVILVVLAAVAAAVIWFLLRKKAAVLPPGQVVYSDTSRRAISEPITSHRLRLTGKPDYVYALPNQAVPVELKRHRAGRFGPRDRDVQQLLTYCVLVEDVWGATVTHGLIEYTGTGGSRFPTGRGSAGRCLTWPRRSGVTGWRRMSPAITAMPGNVARAAIATPAGKPCLGDRGAGIRHPEARAERRSGATRAGRSPEGAP